MDAFVECTDKQLLYRLVHDEDERALDQIYKRYWRQLYNQAFKRLKHQELCEEIVQDVFVDLWVNRKKRNIEHLYPYLQTAIRYQVFMMYHKNKKLPYFEQPLEHIISIPPQADSAFFLSELTAAIESWLDLQPEKRREIFRLRYLEELTTKEIADQLCISQKTVQNQLNIAQGSLRAEVSKLLTMTLLFVDQLPNQ